MTAGTGVVMWLGELITDRGVGNGMSVLIFTSIAARLPSEGWQIGRARRLGDLLRHPRRRRSSSSPLVVFIEQAQRRIPVQYAKRMIGRADVRRHVDVHPAEGQPGRRVIPVIFASSLLYLPHADRSRFMDPNEPQRRSTGS